MQVNFAYGRKLRSYVQQVERWGHGWGLGLESLVLTLVTDLGWVRLGQSYKPIQRTVA